MGTSVEFIHFPNRFDWGNLPARLYNLSYLLFGVFLSSTLITGIGTTMIILRILSATRKNPSIGILDPYRRVQRIVVESGVMYFLSLIATGITLALELQANDLRPGWPPSFPWTWTYAAAFTYSQSILIPVAVRVYFL